MADVVEVLLAADSVEVVSIDNTAEIINTNSVVVEVLAEGPAGPMPTVPAAVSYVVDGCDIIITPGLKGSISLPFNATINSWTLVASPAGSITMDIWKTDFTGFPSNSGNSITGSAKPSILNGLKASSSSLDAWNTAITAGDILTFNVDYAVAVTLASLTLKITRS